MWQRFTERARRIIFFAQEEAAGWGETYVGPEHLLLAVLRDPGSLAVRVLSALEIDPQQLRQDLQARLTRRTRAEEKDMALTPLAKRVIDHAYDEARSLNNNHIGSEHLLLGLTRSSDSIAQRVLRAHGADFDRVRHVVSRIQGVPPGQEAQTFLDEQLSRLPFRDLYRALSTAAAVAACRGKAVITPECLFLALLQPGTPAERALTDAGADLAQLRAAMGVRGWLRPQDPMPDATLDPAARRIIAQMFAQFVSSEARHIDSRQLLKALVDEEPLKAILSREGINLERLCELLETTEN